MNYKLLKDILTEQVSMVLRTDDQGFKTYIPFDENNSSYQEYLEWLELGNTPDPAD